ncbi:MAG: tetratricopeptide repeat protein, partial [bacterium]
MWSKVKRYAFILPLIVGFILRLIHLLAWKNTPFFHNPTVDEFYHYIWAKNIAEKRFELLSGPFFRAPFYPYFLGFLMWIFKEEFFYTRLIQIIIGSITICLVWNLARRVSGSSLVAFLSALIYAFYPIFIYFETRFLLDFLLLFFDTLALLLLLISLERLSYTLLYLSGFIIGVSGITRPNILAIAPILFIWWIINTRKRTNVSVKKALLYFLFILLPLLPVTIYNYYTSGEFIIVSTQGGINFYIGNNPYSDGASSYIQELGTDWQYIDCKHLAELETGKRLTHSELERFYLKKGIDFILNSPYKALKLYIRKLYLLLNKAEISDNQNIDFHRKYSWVLRIPMGYWILAPLGFSALFFARSRKQALLAVFVISYAITLLPFFITARLRLPILPPLIILAVNFFITTLKKASNNPIEFLKRYILFLFFLTICLTNWASINLKDFSHSYYTLGNIYLREGKLDDALESYGQAIKINPTIRNVHLNAGIVYLKLRKFDKAESEFKRELDTDPKSSKAYGNLSILYMLKGDSEKALSHAKKS